MKIDDLTLDEKAEFSEELAHIAAARTHLEEAAKKLEGRGYGDRSHRLRGLSQAVDAQIYLLMQDWRDRQKAA